MATKRKLRPDTADDENLERTEKDFGRARPVWVFPELAEPLQRAGKLGRPPLPEERRSSA